MEATKNITALFELNIPKSAKTLAKFASKDTIRPHFCHVALQPGKGILTASDTHILRVVNVEAQGEFADRLTVFINPKHVAKIAGKKITVAVSEIPAGCGTGQLTEIECEGVTYTTKTEQMTFPDVRRVIPLDETVRKIRLTPGSLEALKKFCKVNGKSLYVAISLTEGSDTALLCAGISDFEDSRAGTRLKLSEPCGITATIGFDPNLLATTLEGCDGTLGIREEHHAAKVYGDADETIIMPMTLGSETEEYLQTLAKETPTDSTFADDAAQAVKALREAAGNFWHRIIEIYTHDGKCSLTPGKYTASDVAKGKPGKYMIFPTTEEEFETPLTIEAGNIRITVPYREIFAMLARWEKLAREKSVFAVGEVEEVEAAVLVPDGDKVEERKMKLRKLGGGWYVPLKRGAKDWEAPVYCEVNGHIIFVRHLPTGTVDDPEKFATFAEGKAERLPGIIQERAKSDIYCAELCRKAGLDTVGVITRAEYDARNEAERIRMQEDNLRHAQESERREREFKEAEQRRKAEVLADGKEKLMNGGRITVEQIELIAGAVGYKINIRTIGFMREKVTGAVLSDDDLVRVSGYKLTSRNIDGTAKVMHELYDRLKAQTEEEAKTAATQVPEASQISTQTAETVNVSAEGEKAAERAENDQEPTAAEVAQMVKTELAKDKAMHTVWHLEFPDGTECDVRYKNTVAGCDFYDYSERNGKIERFRDYSAVVSDITLYICQALGIDTLEPPQSPDTPQAAECTSEHCKLAQTA